MRAARSNVVVFACACLAVAGPVSNSARADIAPDVLTAGPGLAPPEGHAAAKTVRMVSERVVLELHHTPDGAFAVVDATFNMSGPMKGTALPIAFPGEGVMVGGAYATHARLRGFRAFVDGKPVATKEDLRTVTTQAGPPSSPYTRTREEVWHTFPAAIDDATVIRVRYAVEAAAVGYDEKHSHASVQYVLHTGAAWAGTIGEAVVEVRAASGIALGGTSLRTGSMSPVSLVSLKGDGPPPPVMPAGAVRSGAAITWTQKELEPTPKDDVEVVFPSPGTWSSTTPALAARMEAAARG